MFQVGQFFYKGAVFLHLPIKLLEGALKLDFSKIEEVFFSDRMIINLAIKILSIGFHHLTCILFHQLRFRLNVIQFSFTRA